MGDYHDFEDHRVKHLEMIQAVVARLGNNAFLIKGWAITVVGAFVGFAVTRDQWELAVASIAPTLLFWVLDSTFLRNERLFRDLFAAVVRGEAEPFFMGATGPRYVEKVRAAAKRREDLDDVSSRQKTFCSETLLLFYGAVIVIALVVAVILCRT